MGSMNEWIDQSMNGINGYLYTMSIACRLIICISSSSSSSRSISIPFSRDRWVSTRRPHSSTISSCRWLVVTCMMMMMIHDDDDDDGHDDT